MIQGTKKIEEIKQPNLFERWWFNFVMKFRLAFRNDKTFIGDYATAINEAKKFKAVHDIIVLYIEDTRLKPVLIKPETDDKDLIRIAMKAQIRAQYRNKNTRKGHRIVIHYVNDNLIARLVGFRPGKEDLQLLS